MDLGLRGKVVERFARLFQNLAVMNAAGAGRFARAAIETQLQVAAHFVRSAGHRYAFLEATNRHHDLALVGVAVNVGVAVTVTATILVTLACPPAVAVVV